MRAVVLREYGGPEVLAVEEVPEPEPIPTEVQVRVHAAGVNPVDFKTRAGKGMAAVLGEPPVRLGWDVAGVVTEVGAGVTRFQVGDEVFGMPWFPRSGRRLRRVRDRALAPLRVQAARALLRGSGGAAAGRADRLADHRRHDPARGRGRSPRPRRRRRGRAPGGADRQGARRQRRSPRPAPSRPTGCASWEPSGRSTTAASASRTWSPTSTR